MSVNNNIKGIRFNNPIGGVDQFAREMEALEASIPRRPGQTEDISMRIRPRDMTGTLRDFYTNKGQTVTLADGRVVPTSDVIFEVYDDNINFRNVPTDLGNPYNDPRVVPEEKGLVGNEGIMSVAEVLQKDIDASKARGFKMLDRDTAVTLGLISPNVTEYEFEQLKQGNITEPGTYTA